MPQRPCLTCGALGPGSYCDEHRPRKQLSGSHAARGLGARRRAFRRATLALTGGACARCGSTEGIEAHHVVPVAEDPQQTSGIPLCPACHRAVERAARRARRTA